MEHPRYCYHCLSILELVISKNKYFLCCSKRQTPFHAECLNSLELTEFEFNIIKALGVYKLWKKHVDNV